MIVETTPEPTVLPPSRIAKRRPVSQAIGVISSTVISTLSPGRHISTLPNSYNKTFGFIDKLSITMANTTQILSTATPSDLYRICKANGLQDTWQCWGSLQNSRNVPLLNCLAGECDPHSQAVYSSVDGTTNCYCPGVGSVIRLIPGTDLVIPDQPLIPGANANNLVFTIEADFHMPAVPPEYEDNFALWLLFEYVGVATISPGQCDITMNPLGTGAIMESAPVESASATEEPSTVEGSGWLDTLKQIGGLVKNTGLVGNLLSAIPGIGGIADRLLKSKNKTKPQEIPESNTPQETQQ